jgi:hypothetical protein
MRCIIAGSRSAKQGDADALVAIWDGKSPGTKNMIDLVSKHVVFVWRF